MVCQCISLIAPGSTVTRAADTVSLEQDIYVDEIAGKVYKRGQEIPLKGLEFKLLNYLVQNKGRIVPKEELFDRVWEDVFTGDSTLNVHIRHLREKLENHPNEPVHIKTVWGRGYSYED